MNTSLRSTPRKVKLEQRFHVTIPQIEYLRSLRFRIGCGQHRPHGSRALMRLFLARRKVTAAVVCKNPRTRPEVTNAR